MNSSVAAARLTGARPARHEVLADVILDDFRQQAVHGAAARGQQLHCMISRPMAHDLVCWKCGAPLAELTLPLRRLEECPQCHAELHAWEAGEDPGALEAWVHERLRRADADIGRLLAVTSARTVGNTLRPYDDAANELMLSVAQSSVLYGVGATRELRDEAQALTRTANAAYTALSLNQAVYRALAAVPSPADAATRHYLEHTLLEYRLAGVDKDDATRAQIKALQDKITELGLAFERAVHDDVRTTVADKGQLHALPPDYLATHPADAEGHARITTDPPDGWPAQRFSNSAELRGKLYLAAQQVGYPANGETLRAPLPRRDGPARLLGYPT